MPKPHPLGRLTRAILIAGSAIVGLAGPAARAESVAWPAIEPALAADEAINPRIAAILARMTIEQKVGQILQAEIQSVTPADIRNYHIGSVLNGGGSIPNHDRYATPAEWLALADAFYAASIDDSGGGVAIPILWGSDAVHGHNNVIGATLFPHNIGLGAARNPALIRKIGAITAREVRATGIDWTFAPTLAVARNDRWGRTYESYSEDPALVAAYAGEMVLGLQGTPGTAEFLDGHHVIATAKHFLGDGGTDGGDDQGDARISEAELRDIHAAGYFPALAAGAQTVMASFSAWNGQKMHGNQYLLTDVLKSRLGFDGLIVGDWNGHGQVPGCTNISCAAAINAGIDLLMAPNDWKALYQNTLRQVRSGEIPMKRLDDAVTRMLRVKIRAGLFDAGLPSTRNGAGRADRIGHPQHRAVARQAVRESLVLLKNHGDTLPLKPGQTVLVAGDGADSISKQAGGWTISWQGGGDANADFPGATSIYAGIRDAVAAAGGSARLAADGRYGKNRPDVAVVVFGEAPYAEGQGDLETLEFEPGANKSALALLKKLKADGIPTVSVFLSGRPLWVNPELNASDAFVAAWLPGSEGQGIADVLVAGKDGLPRHDFKGRLSFSWPKTPLQDNLNADMPGYDPLFPLGYGLDYASAAKGPGRLPEDVEGVRARGLADIPLYSGRPLAPWLVSLIDDHATQQMSGAYAALPSGGAIATVADKDVQGDAILVRWLNDKPASLALTSGPVLDWSAHFLAGAALIFDLKSDAAIDLGISLRCGEDCRHGYALPKATPQWRTVSIPLACFADAAADFTTITEPFRLTGQGPGEAAIANLKLDLLEEGPIPCPAHP